MPTEYECLNINGLIFIKSKLYTVFVKYKTVWFKAVDKEIEKNIPSKLLVSYYKPFLFITHARHSQQRLYCTVGGLCTSFCLSIVNFLQKSLLLLQFFMKYFEHF